MALLIWLRNLNMRMPAMKKTRAAKSGQPAPEELADDLEKMGPTFIKFGQLLSSRADLLPEPYLKALARLQDKVKPFPHEQVEEIIASELGIRISKAFSILKKNILPPRRSGRSIARPCATGVPSS
jgi:predicted unusual protein kinase regulating ubiquinone biosynthesis (AarF/ABC1/UbiB family)